jgi:hypothetical protein
LDKVIKSNDKIAGNNDNLFVSFTGVDKLGINPTSQYITPLGIYSYPAGYVKSKAGTRNMNHLPFAGDSHYATIFKARGNIIDLTEISDREVNEYYKKIAEYWSKVSGKDWKTSVYQVEDIINDAPSNAKMSSYEGGKLWYVTMKVAGMMARKKPVAKQESAKPDAVSWNTLFRNIGVSGCIDNGVGIIHTSEPHQAVFFDIGAVSVIKRVYNKANYNPLDIKHNAGMGSDLKQYMANTHKKIKNMSVADQEQLVLNNPVNLRYIPNPPEALIYAVLDKYPDSIVNVKKPTEAMKEYSIKLDPDSIQYIKKPSRELQKLAVTLSGNSIKYIIGELPKSIAKLITPLSNEKKIKLYPSEEIQKIAVQNGNRALLIIMRAGIKPSEAVQQAAVKNNGTVITQLMYRKINPSEAVQLLAVKNDPNTLDDILQHRIVPSVAVVTAAGVSPQWLITGMRSAGLPLSPELKQWAGVQ